MNAPATNLAVIEDRPRQQLVPIDAIERMATAVAKSGLFGIKTVDQAMALMLIAQAEGLHPATAAQEYDVIQGRPARKTHSVLARFQSAGGSVKWNTLTDKEADATFSHPRGGSVDIKWTWDMAVKASLTGKDNWKNYPRAMLRSRCVAEGVRTVFPGAIGGMLLVEEAQDMEPYNATNGDAPKIVNKEPEPLPAYTEEQFTKNLPAWQKLIADGKKTAQHIIDNLLLKYTLTEAQVATIKGPAKVDEPAAVDGKFVAAMDKEGSHANA